MLPKPKDETLAESVTRLLKASFRPFRQRGPGNRDGFEIKPRSRGLSVEVRYREIPEIQGRPVDATVERKMLLAYSSVLSRSFLAHSLVPGQDGRPPYLLVSRRPTRSGGSRKSNNKQNRPKGAKHDRCRWTPASPGSGRVRLMG